MSSICRRCTISKLGIGCGKTYEQIQKDNFRCFDERIYYINDTTSDVNDIYDSKVFNKRSAKIHSDMRRSERMLKKT
jgi:hypothetical protein